MRDNIKDEQYFTEFIAEDLNSVLKLSKKIEMGEIKNSRIIPVKQCIFRLKLGIIIAKYSRGDDIQDLKLSFELIFKEWITKKDVVEKTDKINFLVKYLMEEWYNKDCEVYESHKSVQSLYYDVL